MDININVNNNENGSQKYFSFDPKEILSPDFKNGIENLTDKVNEMIEEIDKYYNINQDRQLKEWIRDMMESRIKFMESYTKFSEWYKNNR